MGNLGDPGETADASPIDVRVDFSSLALFAPRVRTDASGRATAPVKLPDNLTRYRVMTVASAGANFFGSSEATITARLPLMVRPSAPRFLNFGDAFDLSVVIQNQTDAPVDADVVVRATNATIRDGAKRVTVPRAIVSRSASPHRRGGRARRASSSASLRRASPTRASSNCPSTRLRRRRPSRPTEKWTQERSPSR